MKRPHDTAETAAAAERLAQFRGRLLTIQDVAAAYRIHVRTVERYVNAGRIPAPDYRFCTFVRWKLTTLLKAIQ